MSEKVVNKLGIGIMLVIIFGIWGFFWTFPLMWAWNYAMPHIFGLPTVTYWQMWCLYFVLTSLWKVTPS